MDKTHDAQQVNIQQFINNYEQNQITKKIMAIFKMNILI